MTTIRIRPDRRFDYEASSNPLVSTNPEAVPATWLNSTSGEIFVCIDNTTGSNVWTGQQGSVVS